MHRCHRCSVALWLRVLWTAVHLAGWLFIHLFWGIRSKTATLDSLAWIDFPFWFTGEDALKMPHCQAPNAWREE